MQKAYDEYIEIANKVDDDFWDSQERIDASAKAYDDTYKFYQKENPEWLSRIVRDNGGKKTGLDAYHDFRKTFEGFEDEYWYKAKEEFDKRTGYSDEKRDTAWNNYTKARNEMVDDIIGKYGKKKIKHINAIHKRTVDDLVKSYANDIPIYHR